MAIFEIPTPAELAEITRRTEERMRRQLLAVSARYDRRSGRVVIHLNSGALVGFPLSALPGLEQATPEDLGRIVVEGGGYGLRVESLDADISMPQLLADQLGSTIMKRAITRAKASRANGHLGGRPRKAATG
jgi:hypothetical protein